ncbi:hypothetical protein [Brachybacterium aquaticum]|uniref:Uncharacterized protein n=1 Tax=Brachybacterium aquaticum TaxID=1432564 RepID=A0A841AIC6_9MICO|nr:hypothetical protein [Brachybacterium aquaticum]MBB5833020.1 hypothetical protein [Brachybacterium aquaticum]
MSELGSRIAESRWRYLRLGLLAALPLELAGALLFGLGGLVLLFVMALIGGFAGEEVLAGTEVGTTMDLVARASAGAALVLGAVGGLLMAFAGSLHGPAHAWALDRAAERTPPQEVPHPEQWRWGQEPTGSPYKYVAIAVLVVGGFFYLLWVAAGISSGDGADGIVLGGGLALALVAGGIPLTGRVMGGWQETRFRRAEEHWTEQHRIIAAGHVLTRAEVEARRAGLPPERHPAPTAKRLEQALFAILGPAAGVGLIALQLIFVIAYPDAERGPGGQVGERAELTEAAEQVVDLLAVIMAVCALLALLAFAGAVACDVVIHRAATRRFRAVLADPGAPLPEHASPVAELEPSTPPSLRVVQVLVGTAVGLGAALWFVDAIADQPDWQTYAAAGPALRAAAPLGAWLALAAFVVLLLTAVVGVWLHQREQPLRDAVVQRWPVRAEAAPKEESDEESEAETEG